MLKLLNIWNKKYFEKSAKGEFGTTANRQLAVILYIKVMQHYYEMKKGVSTLDGGSDGTTVTLQMLIGIVDLSMLRHFLKDAEFLLILVLVRRPIKMIL
jgi:hypothetical protein